MNEDYCKLYVGWSPNGAAVGPSDQVDGIYTLEEAKAIVEVEEGRTLEWFWMEERKVHRAVLGHERAVEIEPTFGPLTSIVVNAGTM